MVTPEPANDSIVDIDAVPADAGCNASSPKTRHRAHRKIYQLAVNEVNRYSPPAVIGTRSEVIRGNPDPTHINTSFVERANPAIRMSNRRFTRLTNGFSKKAENHGHALAFQFVYYNFARIHQTLRVTPAMPAGIADHVWSIEKIVCLLG